MPGKGSISVIDYFAYFFDRIGMHLLFYGHEQVEILETKKVENLLREQSIKVFITRRQFHRVSPFQRILVIHNPRQPP